MSKRVLAALLLVAAAQLAPAQASAPLTESAARPFAVGERSVYDVNFWIFGRAGSSTIDVLPIDTVRGRDAYRFMFTVTGGVPFYKIRDTLQSWVDTAGFRVLRFMQDQEEGGKNRTRDYAVFPDRLVYSESGKPELPSVANPLDEISFLFFVRSQKLTVGDTYTYQNYFKPESNPVKLIVLRKEQIDVPYGKKISTIVVQPIIKTRGLFSQGGRAEVWFSDDSARIIVQMKSHLSVGTLTMRLKSYRASASAEVRLQK